MQFRIVAYYMEGIKLNLYYALMITKIKRSEFSYFDNSMNEKGDNLR